MAQSQQQFSPAQILHAARRAEAEGRDEYALQFFQHLSEYYGTTPEGRAANDAVARVNQRLQGRRQGTSTAQNNTGHLQSAQHSQTVSQAQNAAQSASMNVSDGLQESLRNLRNGFSGVSAQQNQAQARAPAQHGEAHPVQPARAPVNGNGSAGHHHHRAQHSAQPTTQQTAPVASHAPQARESAAPAEQSEPAKARSYSIGRLLALIVIVLGGGALAAAVGLLAAILLAPGVIYSIAGEISMFAGGLIAWGTFCSGLVMILSGLVARAVFHNAANVQMLTAAHNGARAR